MFPSEGRVLSHGKNLKKPKPNRWRSLEDFSWWRGFSVLFCILERLLNESQVPYPVCVHKSPEVEAWALKPCKLPSLIMIQEKRIFSLRQHESQRDVCRVEGSRWDIVHVYKQVVGHTENLGYRKAYWKDFPKCLIPDSSGTFSITASRGVCTYFWLCWS